MISLNDILPLEGKKKTKYGNTEGWKYVSYYIYIYQRKHLLVKVKFCCPKLFNHSHLFLDLWVWTSENIENPNTSTSTNFFLTFFFSLNTQISFWRLTGWWNMKRIRTVRRFWSKVVNCIRTKPKMSEQERVKSKDCNGSNIWV